MGMFDKYENIIPDYIPDNTSPTLDDYTFTSIDSDLPRPLINWRGNKIGYTWNNGELFDFNLTVDDMIAIRRDSLVFDKSGEGPDAYTIGEHDGQQAYNTVDAKSWTFIGKSGDLYVWVEDEELLYPVDGEKSIIIHTDMNNKYVQLNIYDFRWQLVHSIKNEIGNPHITLKVDEDISKKLIPGVYYATLNICSDYSKFLKSKFMISIN